MTKKILTVICLMFLTLPAFAAKNAWRQCGIGAAIFPRTGWAAVTSNIIWDFGITASTSSMSSESQCAGRASTAAKFIHQNFAMLEEETASGSGDHIVTVLNILDCNKKSHGNIINEVRSNFASELLEGSSTDEAYYNNLMNLIERNYATQ